MELTDPAELRERVIGALCDIAFADISDYVEIDTSDGEPRLYYRGTKLIPPEKRAAIAAIRMGTKGVEIKLYDRLSALEKLGKMCGIFDRREEAETEDMDGIVSDVFGETDEQSPDD